MIDNIIVEVFEVPYSATIQGNSAYKIGDYP